MGSFKGKGRNQGRDLRRGARGQRSSAFRVESLEDRLLLASTWQPTSTNLADVKAGPMANAGQDLINIYQTYLSDIADPSKVASQFGAIKFQGGSVGVDVNWTGEGDFAAYTASLSGLGMQVNTSDAAYGIVEGYLPLGQLP